MHEDTVRRSKGPWVMSFLLAAQGAALGTGGLWLVAHGDTWYYLLAGLGSLLTAVLLARRRASALWAYAILLAATLGWALWEAGLDWWPLAARLDVGFVLGLMLMLAWVRKALHVGEQTRGGTALAVVLVACLLTAAASWLHDPRAIEGRLPAAPQAAGPADPVPEGQWHAYGRGAHGQRYSPLAQITPQNVRDLKVAWHYRTGDVRGRPGDPKETTFEVTPLKVGERLFLCTPHQSVIALDATTGRELWRRDLALPQPLALQHLTCRGLAYQPARVGAGGVNDGCTASLFMPTADGRLVALNPETGADCSSFGRGRGAIDLWAHMPNRRPGAYYATSPPVVTSRLLIVGGTVLDNVSVNEQSGVIRAFDIDTGELVWNWDSGNPEATAPIAPGRQYLANSPNSWSVSSVDEALGMVYVPMGNQPPDQWGGRRSEAVERYSSSVVALDLDTGRVRWVFQTVHHDLWDYDVPSQPSLLDLRIGERTVPALVQPTKQGELFVLDRRDGRPLLPVREVPAPQGAALGDRTHPTQPESALSFSPAPLRGRDMWGATPFDQLACRIAFHRLRYEGRFTPPSTQGTLVHPGNFGVFNWGSIAVDPRRGIAFTTPTYLAFVSELVPRPDDRTLLVQERGERPPGSLPALNENFGAPFASKMEPFLSPLGIPCQEPPWGYVAGVDLAKGHVVWMHRNGTVRDLAPVPVPLRMGVPNLGGPVVTAGGVAFLSGTMDYYVRAYDVTDGRELWKHRLPAGGQATPMTYTGADGRQYLLVAAGGHGSTETKAGDSVIAYALPRR